METQIDEQITADQDVRRMIDAHEQTIADLNPTVYGRLRHLSIAGAASHSGSQDETKTQRGQTDGCH
jgi:anti-sigma-K factor RskA